MRINQSLLFLFTTTGSREKDEIVKMAIGSCPRCHALRIVGVTDRRHANLVPTGGESASLYAPYKPSFRSPTSTTTTQLTYALRCLVVLRVHDDSSGSSRIRPNFAAYLAYYFSPYILELPYFFLLDANVTRT